MKYISDSCSDTGPVMDVNEDCCYADDGRRLYAVADGVGRYKGADAASRTIIQSVVDHLSSSPPSKPQERRKWVGQVIHHAAAALQVQADQTPRWQQMRSTLTAVRFDRLGLLAVHVGDCRLYRCRNQQVELLTQDHTVAFQEYRGGLIDENELLSSDEQHVLTRSLGPSHLDMPDIVMESVHAADRYILCTDGITNTLPASEFCDLVVQPREPGSICMDLVHAARRTGGRDNSTVVVIDVHADDDTLP